MTSSEPSKMFMDILLFFLAFALNVPVLVLAIISNGGFFVSMFIYVFNFFVIYLLIQYARGKQ